MFTTGFGPGVVFRLGGQKCKREELRVYLLDVQKECEALCGDALWEGSDSERLQEAVREQALSRVSRVKALVSIGIRENMMLNMEENLCAERAQESYLGGLSDEEKEYLKIDEKKLLKVFKEYALADRVYRNYGDSAQEVYEKFCRETPCDLNRKLWQGISIKKITPIPGAPGFSECYEEQFAALKESAEKDTSEKEKDEEAAPSEEETEEKTPSEETVEKTPAEETAEKASSEEAAEKASSEEEAAEKASSKKKATEKSASEEKASEKSSSEEKSKAAEKSASEKKTAGKSTSEEKAAGKSTSEEKTSEKSSSEKKTTEKSSSEEKSKAAEKSSSEKKAAEKSTSEGKSKTTEKSSSKDKASEKSSEESSSKKKAAEKASSKKKSN